MRIVAGRYRGRRLQVPAGYDVRPSSERSREALFNILESGRLTEGQHAVRGARVLDAFAGSGALGIEALSRGASEVFFLEQAPAALRCLRQNLQGLESSASLHILKEDALNPPPAERPVDILLMDPPYGQGLTARALPALTEKGWLDGDTLAVVESARKELQALPADFQLLDRRTYGRAELSFLMLTKARTA